MEQAEAAMQTAVITGAGSGIGLACAVKLAEAGMAIVGVGRDPEKLAELEKAVGDPNRVATLSIDVTQDDAPRRIVELAVSRFGKVDFLVNNAGMGSPRPVHESDDAWLDESLDLMLRAPFRLCRECLPHMPPGSAIINIENEVVRKMNVEMTPHTRRGTVDDVAATVAFLCSEGGSFINGQTIAVDGGWTTTKFLSEFGRNSVWTLPET
jgi:NAD(P)-dependent dehydrogenase (short-subunit alcohol dehydrogenase family)